RFVVEQLVDEPGEAPPALRLLVERARTGLGDAVVLRLAIALGPLPRALDPTLLLEPDQRGIQRALIEEKRMLGHLLEPRRQSIRVLRPHRRQRAKDDEIQRALKKLDFLAHATTPLPIQVENVTASTGLSS